MEEKVGIREKGLDGQKFDEKGRKSLWEVGRVSRKGKGKDLTKHDFLGEKKNGRKARIVWEEKSKK